MLSEFFKPHPEHTSKMLGLTHILILIFGTLLVVLIAKKLKISDTKKRDWLYKGLALFACSLDPIYYIWELSVNGKINPSTSLPLYFCSIFFFTAFVFAFSNKKSKVHHIAKNYLCTMNIICAALGLIFLVYFNRYPAFHFVIVRSLIYHFLMILYPLIIYFNKDYKPLKNDWLTFIIPALFIMIPAFIVDMIFKWDYCYFNGGVDTPVYLFIGVFHPLLRLVSIVFFFFSLTNLVFFLPRYIINKRKSKNQTLINN